MLLLSSLAIAEDAAQPTASQAESTEEGTDAAASPQSEQDTESGAEDRSEPMTLETKKRDDNLQTDFPVGPVILGAYGVVTIVIGAGFGWQADQEYDNWKEARDSGDAAATKRLADDVDAHSIAANVLLFGGTALLATSVIWWLLSGGDDEDDGAGEARVQAAAGPGQAGIYVTF